MTEKPWDSALEAYRRANPHREDELDEALAMRDRMGDDSLEGEMDTSSAPPPDEEPEALPLFDPALAQAAARDGMSKAMQAERVQDWKVAASAWLDAQPSGTEFHFDDLTAAVGVPDEGANRNNVMGAWVSAQASYGHIYFTGRYHKSARVARKGGVHRVWRKR